MENQGGVVLMQISRAGNWSRWRRGDGFTLLELMVVLVILSIMVVIVVPRALNILFATNLRSEARRVSLLIEEVRASAIERRSPAVMEFNPEKDEILYSCFSCKKKMRSLKIEGMHLSIKTLKRVEKEKCGKDRDGIIRIWALPDGIMTPFKLTLRDRFNREISITVHPFILLNSMS